MKSKKPFILKKLTALVLSVSLLFIAIYNMESPNLKGLATTKKTETEKKIETEYPEILTSPNKNTTDGKEETVYTIMDADGNIEKMIVNEWLKNGKKENSIRDRSNLENVENTTGHETFQRDGETLKWDAKGNDIRYQGSYKGRLPVEVNISYILDGKKMSAKEMEGKKGNIQIIFDYKINRRVTSNGYNILQPYTMASGVILGNSHFTDITITNGKIINDGSNSVCLGIAFPGLKENIGLTDSQLEIPSRVVIDAYTDNFNIDGTYSIAMSGLLTDLDMPNSNSLEKKVEDLSNSLGKLSDSSEKLVSGSKKLKHGTEDLKEGAKELQKGSALLKVGMADFAKGSKKEKEGLKALRNGLSKISQKSSVLNQGAVQIESSIFQAATKEFQNQLLKKGLPSKEVEKMVLTPENYTQILANLSQSAVNKAESTLRNTLSASGISDKSIQDNIISLAYNKVMADKQGQQITVLSEKEASKYMGIAGEKAKDALYVSQGVSQYSKRATQLLGGKGDENAVMVMSTALKIAADQNRDETFATMEAVREKATSMVINAGEYTASIPDAKSHVQQFASLLANKSSIDDSTKGLLTQLNSVAEYVAGVKLYTANVDRAANASAKLYDGIKQMDRATSKFVIGSSDLYDGLTSLSGGVDILSEGTDALNTGMYKFNRDGIQRLVKTLNKGQLKEIFKRLKATSKVSKEEFLIGDKSDEMEGSSKIIFRTGKIGK